MKKWKLQNKKSTVTKLKKSQDVFHDAIEMI